MQNKAKQAIAAALSATLAFSGATAPMLSSVAYADEASDLQSQLDAANARLNSLYQQAESISEQLNDTRVRLEDTKSKISELDTKIEQQETRAAPPRSSR